MSHINPDYFTYENPYLGKVYIYSKRNYRVSDYTFKKMLSLSYQKEMIKDLYAVTFIAKQHCLAQAQRDTDTTMFAIEKDEEYLPEFKTCVGKTIQ